MIDRPTRVVSITNQPTNIRKVPGTFPDVNAYPVTYSTLRYPSGAGSIEMVSNGMVAQATGTLTAGANPLNTETVSVNGVTFTFVTGSSTATNVHIGATAAETMINFAIVLNASANAAINIATYSVSGAILTITFTAPGDTGNAYTLANSSGTAAITRSAATLAGGAPSPGVGKAVDAGQDYVDNDQNVGYRYAIASTGTISLSVTDTSA